MNGNKLIDTNILIYLSQKKLKLENIADSQSKLYISVITYIEALGFNFKKEDEKLIIKKLCKEMIVINLDDNIIEEIIKIKQSKKIKLPDAVIAATAIQKNLQLVTANVDDFKSISSKLNIINPVKSV
jgi:predicted nucleic acid-binding protein